MSIRDRRNRRVPDAKTDAGSPDLVEGLVAHVDRLRRAGLPTHPTRRVRLLAGDVAAAGH
jgi:hypothetical protein